MTKAMLLTESMRVSEPSESTASFLKRNCKGKSGIDSPVTVFRPSYRTLNERTLNYGGVSLQKRQIYVSPR